MVPDGVWSFAMAEVEEGPKLERSKWRSPTYLVGAIVAFLGLSVLLYRAYSKYPVPLL
jgi:hypothetical protein